MSHGYDHRRATLKQGGLAGEELLFAKSWRLRDDAVIWTSLAADSGSNKGHDTCCLQCPSVPVGCHLRRKVVGFAASHEAVNRRVVGSSPT